MLPTLTPNTRILKIGGIAIGVVLLLILIVASVSWYHTHQYNKLQLDAQIEREGWAKEKQKLLEEAAAQEAVADIKGQVAVSKKADRARVIKELDDIEQQHKQRKTEVEASSSQLSDDALVDELCRKLVERGYPPCPPK